MLAPIRPRPIIPICIISAPSLSRRSASGVAVIPNEGVGGAVVLERWLIRVFEFRDNALGQHLAEFDAPLIEGIDVPDRALRKDAVLIERKQFTETFWGQPLGQDRRRGSVSLECAMRHQPFWRAFRFDFLGRAA